MKNSIRFNLLKMNLLNQFKIQEYFHGEGKVKKQRRNTLLIAFIVIFAVMSYSCGFAYGLKELGFGRKIPLIAFTISGLVVFIESIFKINTTLYGGKDYDILMSFPIKVKDVVFSKTDMIVIMDTFLCAIIMIPMGIIYSTMTYNKIIFWIIWIIGLAAISLIFVCTANIVSLIVSSVVTKMKISEKAYILVMTGLILIIMCASMIYVNMNLHGSSINEIVDSISNLILKYIPGANIFNLAVRRENILVVLIITAIICIIYHVCAIVIAKVYVKNAFIFRQSNVKVNDINEMKYSSGSILGSLYRKEIKHYFFIPIYVFNSGIGATLAVIFSIIIAFGGVDNIETLVRNLNIDVNNIIMRCGNYIIVLLISLSCTTYASISLEGDTAWIMKSIPITGNIIIKSKILVNLTITIPAAIISSLIFSLSYNLSFSRIIINIITQLIFALFVAEWGIFVNLRNINFEWTNEVQVIKEGITVIVGIIGGFTLSAIVLTLIYLSQDLSYIFVSIIINLVIIGILRVMYINNIKNIEEIL